MSVINNLPDFSLSKASVVSYDNSVSGLDSTNVQSGLDEAAALNRMNNIPITLKSSNWGGIKPPYSYRLDIAELGNDDYVMIHPNKVNGSTYSDEYNAILNANIEIDTYGEGYIVLTALNEKPLIDVNIMVSIGKIINVPEGRDASYIKFTPPEGSQITANNLQDALLEFFKVASQFREKSDASGVSFDDTIANFGTNNIQDAIDYIAQHGIGGGTSHRLPVHQNVTIPASGWVGTTSPYINRVKVDGVLKYTRASVAPIFDIEPSQFKELSDAEIVTGETTVDGEIVLKAFGNKPTVDIPVDVTTYKTSWFKDTITTTILADGWYGNTAPYLNSLTIEGVDIDENTQVLLNPIFDISNEQYQALSAASIITGKTTSNGEIVLKAFGDLPNINLPVEIIIVDN